MSNDALMTQLHGDLMAMQATALASGPDLDRPVPTCPGWTVTQLLGHLWAIQTWVQSILRTGEAQPTREASPSPVADFVEGVPDFLTAMRAITAHERAGTSDPRRDGRAGGFDDKLTSTRYTVSTWRRPWAPRPPSMRPSPPTASTRWCRCSIRARCNWSGSRR